MAAKFKKSKVWDHFSQDGDIAKRNACNTEFTCKGGCTNAMRNHCRSKHKISFETQETAPKKSHLQTKIIQFTRKESLTEIYSR